MPLSVRVLTVAPLLIVVALLIVLGDKVGWGLVAAVLVIVAWSLGVVLVLRRRARNTRAEAAIGAIGRAGSGGWTPRRRR